MTERKTGRPALPPGESKTEILAIRVTPSDKAKAKRLGASIGGSASDWVTAQIRKAKEPNPQS